MKSIVVKGKNIPLAGSTELIVQGEISAEELRFVFNTKGEHSELSSATTWKLWYKRRDGQGLPVTLTKTTNQDGTWYVSWTPDNHATYLNGQFVFLIAAYSTVNDTNPVWKTTACVITIAKSVDPEIIDPSEKTLSYDQIVDELENWVTAQKGVANGIATLDASGKVPASQLDIGELDNYEIGYLYEGNFYKDAEHTQLMTPKENAIYVNKSTNPASLYVYNNNQYQPVSIESLSNYYTKSEINTLLNNINIAITNETTARQGADTSLGNRITTIEGKEIGWDAKSVVSVSSTGTSTDEVQYIVINGIEKKIAGSGQVEDVTVNGVSVLDTDKVAKVIVPTKTSDITNDSDFITSSAVASGYVAKETGKGLSTNDFTDEEKAKTDSAYQKPNTGIPSTDMSEAVQTSLGKADTAIQEHQSLAAYRTSADQDVIDNTKVDKVEGSSLMTSAEHTKLEGIETGAEENVIETVKVNNVPLVPSSKAVNVDLSNYATKADVTNIYRYMGSVATYNDLPTTYGASDVGKAFNVIAKHGHYPAGTNYAWTWDTSTSTGAWDPLGGSVDLSAYRTSADQDVIDATKASASVLTTHTSNTTVHITAAERQTWNAKQDALTNTDAQIQNAVSKTHEHSNKALLDTYTQTEANIADSVSKKHTHSNKSELDLIASGDKAKWDAKSDFSGSYNDLTNVPSTFPPSSHNHDDRYYTETETNTLLNDKVSYQDIVSTTGSATNKAISQSKYTSDQATQDSSITNLISTTQDHETRISAIENSDSLIKVTAYHANSFISGLTVQVKQGSTVRYTGTTDSNGYCEIRVANGNYTVHGVYDNDYTTVIDADVVAPKFGEVSCRIVGLKTGEMTWSLFQQYVQDGTIKSVLAIGDEVTVSRGNTDLTFQHVAFDKMTTSPASTHNSVIMMKDMFADTIQFDREEAFIYAQEEMPAGTYHVNLYKASMIYYLNAGLQNKDLQFTITTPIPAGGQIMVTGGNFSNTTTVAGLVLTSYASRGATTILETNIACSEGTSGTDLGSANTVANSGKVNSTDRCLYGSNRWKWSALRQWLNSDQPRGSWWTPQSPFDRKPSQADSVDGWLYGLNADLLAVIKPVKNIQVLNWFDGGTNEETEDYFFVPSMSQVYMTSTLTEGACWDWYDSKANGGNSDLTTAGTGADSNRIKKRNVSAYYWWLRTPLPSYSSYECFVGTTGAYYNGSACNSIGVAPACCIA